MADRSGSGSGSGSGRKLALALIGIGVFLLVAALMIPTYTLGKLRTTPLDLEVTTVAEGTGDVLNAKELLGGKVQVDTGVPIVAQRFVTVEDPADSQVMTVQAGQSVRRLDMQGDTGLLSATVDRATIDRRSAMPVHTDDSVSTIQTSSQEPPRQVEDRDGLQYKFPFSVEKKDYPYFDLNAMQNTTISFVEETEIEGMTVYHFSQTIDPVDMTTVDPKNPTYRLAFPAEVWGVPGEGNVTMKRFYSNVRDLWVDPVTGVVVKGQEQQYQFYAREGSKPEVTVLKVSLPFNQDTIEFQAQQARDGQSKLSTFGRTLPIVLGILGLISLIAGLILGLRGRRRKDGAATTSVRNTPSGGTAAAAGAAGAGVAGAAATGRHGHDENRNERLDTGPIVTDGRLQDPDFADADTTVGEIPPYRDQPAGDDSPTRQWTTPADESDKPDLRKKNDRDR